MTGDRQFDRGLVVGKFAPLHRGHELVVGRALSACREVLVLSYTVPEFRGCEPERRRAWLERAFPGARVFVLTDEWLAARLPGAPRIPPNDAPDLSHRRFVASVCLDALGTTVDAVFTSEAYGDGFAAELSTAFRERFPGHPEVAHVLVDRERAAVPISASLIREDVHRRRAFLSPPVYASFVERVTILGGESSGKSTLAAALASAFDTTHVEEYGREFWDRRGGELRYEDMLHIAERQVELEDAALERSNRYLFCDTSPLTTLFYSRDLFGRADARLEALAERRYALTVLCAPDFPFVQDGTRRDAAFRAAQHRYYEEELRRRNVHHVVVAGGMDVRVRAVRHALGYSASR